MERKGFRADYVIYDDAYTWDANKSAWNKSTFIEVSLMQIYRCACGAPEGLHVNGPIYTACRLASDE